MEKVFCPDRITNQLIKNISSADELDITFADYNSLGRDPLWNDFLNVVKKKIIKILSFYVRLDTDSEGKYIKTWGDIDFLELISGKEIDTLKVINCNSLKNLQHINNVQQLIIRQTVAPIVSILPIERFSLTLRKLYIEKNICDLRAIRELHQLNFLNITAVKKFDLYNICNLKLQTLELIKSSIINTKYLGNMDRLLRVYLYGDNSNDYNFLNVIPNLKVLVFDRCKNLKVLPSLKEFCSLEHLTLENVNYIENLKEVKNAPNLKSFTHIDSNNNPEDYLFLTEMRLEECNIYAKTDSLQQKINSVVEPIKASW